MNITMFKDLRATIIGAAREGTALSRFLAERGADVTLSDTKPMDELSDVIAELADLPIKFALGGNPPDILEADILFLSPGVPSNARIVQEAREKGLPISSEPRLFTQLCPAPVVGITGSSGKTTTTALLGEIYAAAGKQAWVGGNIGRPLINELSEKNAPDVAVMELSSFQLELFRPDYQGAEVKRLRSPASRVISLAGWSPALAVVTNITPNHLDRHESMENYIEAKSAILDCQQAHDWAVLNGDDPLTRKLEDRTRGYVAFFSLTEPVERGGMLRDNALWLRLNGRETRLCDRDEIRLRGEHNLYNVLAAACAATIGGIDDKAIRTVITRFEGVPHRLETVRRWNDVTFVNDSIATSPERSIAALRAFDEPLVLLAGGRDKNLDWEEWASWVSKKTRAVVAFGECAPLIEQALAQEKTALYRVTDLSEAVHQAAKLAQPGDIVLLSPGGTSFDAFVDFEARGRAFRQLVNSL